MGAETDREVHYPAEDTFMKETGKMYRNNEQNQAARTDQGDQANSGEVKFNKENTTSARPLVLLLLVVILLLVIVATPILARSGPTPATARDIQEVMRETLVEVKELLEEMVETTMGKIRDLWG